MACKLADKLTLIIKVEAFKVMLVFSEKLAGGGDDPY